jgi:hypothetical protein
MKKREKEPYNHEARRNANVTINGPFQDINCEIARRPLLLLLAETISQQKSANCVK